MRLCDIPECGRKHKGHGLCTAHLVKMRQTGSPTTMRRVPDHYDRRQRLEFYGWTVVDLDCWEWNGRRDHRNYGRLVDVGGKARGAHRVAYQAWVGPIPEGQVVRHKCDNPPCINPGHLEAGTHADNSQDMVTRGRWSGNDKISRQDAEDIRWLLSWDAKPKDIAAAFSISRASVYDIRKGRTWV